MMFDYEYYLKNINNYESVINNMHNNLSRSNVDKIQSSDMLPPLKSQILKWGLLAQ